MEPTFVPLLFLLRLRILTQMVQITQKNRNVHLEGLNMWFYSGHPNLLHLQFSKVTNNPAVIKVYKNLPFFPTCFSPYVSTAFHYAPNLLIFIPVLKYF